MCYLQTMCHHIPACRAVGRTWFLTSGSGHGSPELGGSTGPRCSSDKLRLAVDSHGQAWHGLMRSWRVFFRTVYMLLGCRHGGLSTFLHITRRRSGEHAKKRRPCSLHAKILRHQNGILNKIAEGLILARRASFRRRSYGLVDKRSVRSLRRFILSSDLLR